MADDEKIDPSGHLCVMAGLYSASQPTVSRIAAAHRAGQAERAVLNKSAGDGGDSRQ
ncbi:MAG TPA: hypothetical protein VFE41_15510 [Acetobacteraceae bacterium]|jgi:hypothetical protein|nr:hypothetical protein [Acetobacteraceae bacterium]